MSRPINCLYSLLLYETLDWLEGMNITVHYFFPEMINSLIYWYFILLNVKIYNTNVRKLTCMYILNTGKLITPYFCKVISGLAVKSLDNPVTPLMVGQYGESGPWVTYLWPMTHLTHCIRDPAIQTDKKCKGNYIRVNSVQSKSFLCPLWFTRKGGKQQIGKNEGKCIAYLCLHTYIIISIRSCPWAWVTGSKGRDPVTHGPLWYALIV